MQPDSGFFCEGNSSDDDVVLKEEFRGMIVKQGCLLKQVGTTHFLASHWNGYRITLFPLKALKKRKISLCHVFLQ